MKLAIFNGSPRNKKSNSAVIIDQFLSGYKKHKSEEVPVLNIAERNKSEERINAFSDSENVIIVFPLYTDSMPGIVKEFIEQVYNLETEKTRKIGFIVQSGFPESVHSLYVEKYLEKLTKRMNLEYSGTVIRGGSEGIRLMPAVMTEKLFRRLRALGEHYAGNYVFSQYINNEIRKPYKLSKSRIIIFKLLSITGITNFYWNMNLKKNKAYRKRFDRPYCR